MKVVLQDFKYGRIMRTDSDFYVGDSIALCGEYLESQIDIFRQFIHDGDYILDVGANIGACTIQLAKLAGKMGRVFAFESQRVVFQMLAGNVMLNNLMNVYTKNICIGAKRAKTKIADVFINEDILCTNMSGLSIGEHQGKYEIDIIPIDDLKLSKCSFIRSNIEGMGYEVLLGAQKTIEKFMPIIYVEHESGEDGNKILEFLKEHKYRIYRHKTSVHNKHSFFGDFWNVLDDHKKLLGAQESYCSFAWLCIYEKSNYEVKGLEPIFFT